VRSNRLHGIDALRGLAACGIVVVHAAFIHPVGAPESVGLLSMGVPLFFMISAFSLSIAYSGGMYTKVEHLRYAIRRFARLAPLFYVILAAWLIYIGALGGQMPTLRTIFLNLCFLFGMDPSTQTSIVPAGWSIGVEMIFYALFPVFCRFRTVAANIGLVAGAFIACGIFNYFAHENVQYFHWTHFLTNAPYFALGLLAYRVHNSLAKERQRFVGLACLLFSLIIIGLMILFGPQVTAMSVKTQPVQMALVTGWGLAFFLLLLSQVFAPIWIISNPATLFLGRISYSIYLIHPLLIFATPVAPWVANSTLPWQLKMLAIGSIALASSILSGWVLYWSIEKPGQEFGRKISNVLRGPVTVGQ
jgi:peptidoglycan/LPS O-acetylase OafA/YrhL